jgi:hypothetical protein
VCALLSCSKYIYFGDKVKLKGDINIDAENIQIISSDKDSVTLVPLKAGEHILKINNDDSNEIIIKVKTLLTKDTDKKILELIKPKRYNYYSIIFILLISVLILISIFYVLFYKKNRDYLKELKSYKNRSFEKNDIYLITNILRDYICWRYNLKKGISNSKILTLKHAKMLEEILDKADKIKFSNLDLDIDSQILDVIIEYISKDMKRIDDK